MSDDLWWSYVSESVEAGLPFVAPPPPESFEEEFEGLELDSDEDAQFTTLLDAPFPTYPETAAPTVSSSSGSTYSMDLTEDTSNSEYSSMTFSSYSPLVGIANDVDFGPAQFAAVNPKHISLPFDISAFPDLDASLYSEGIAQFSAANFQDLQIQVAKAQFDDGPYRPSIGVSPDVLSGGGGGGGGFHRPTPAVPTDPPVGGGSATPSHTGPMRSKFVCPHCGHGSARKHNLKTHMDTHNPNRKKPFVCPDSACAHPFTRKHDLKRHLEAMHGEPPAK